MGDLRLIRNSITNFFTLTVCYFQVMRTLSSPFLSIHGVITFTKVAGALIAVLHNINLAADAFGFMSQ